MWKIELHSHCADDPKDFIDYPVETLIDTCIAHGYHALAITMHGATLDRPEAFEYARSKNFLLIPGIEKWVEGKEVLLLNVTPEEVSGAMDFARLRKLRESKGNSLFVMAPHPFFPGTQCLHGKLRRHIELFDAVEHCYFYLPWINFNRPAEQIAREFHKPLIATGDIHHLSALNRSYALVDAGELSIPAIFAALRAGKFRNVHRPVSMTELIHGVTAIAHDKLRRSLGIKNVSH